MNRFFKDVIFLRIFVRSEVSWANLNDKIKLIVNICDLSHRLLVNFKNSYEDDYFSYIGMRVISLHRNTESYKSIVFKLQCKTK